MTNPLIQIDDEVREMTDEEYATYVEETKNEFNAIVEKAPTTRTAKTTA